MLHYVELWLQHMEADPDGGTVASVYRSVIYALNHSPLMGAIVKRDEKTFGKYLRKQSNIFQLMQSPIMTRDFLKAMQDAGAVRKDVNVSAMAYLLDVISYSLVSEPEDAFGGSQPTFDEIMTTVADMLEHTLNPQNGTNHEAGKAVLRKFIDDARAHFEEAGQSQEDTSS